MTFQPISNAFNHFCEAPPIEKCGYILLALGTIAAIAAISNELGALDGARFLPWDNSLVLGGSSALCLYHGGIITYMHIKDREPSLAKKETQVIHSEEERSTSATSVTTTAATTQVVDNQDPKKEDKTHDEKQVVIVQQTVVEDDDTSKDKPQAEKKSSHYFDRNTIAKAAYACGFMFAAEAVRKGMEYYSHNSRPAEEIWDDLDPGVPIAETIGFSAFALASCAVGYLASRG